MGTIYIDGQAVSFKSGDNVLQAALRAGIKAPHFCYHEALGSVGSCRLCAMEVAGKSAHEAGKVVMSCLQPATEGQHYKYQSREAKVIQKGVIEYLMTRHPHDCPVCDQAGECHLQDMTISSEHRLRRYDGNKMTYPSQQMGPLIWNEANRCITCYRCVRFYQDYALSDDFGVYGSTNRVSFRRSESGAFDSPFSGNLVDVCPTGVFTDKVYRRRYSRTWQLEKAVSVCELCSVGCQIEPGGRDGSLRRIHPYNSDLINRFFICDRGRYGAHYSEAKDRPLKAIYQGNPVDEESMIDKLHGLLTNTKVGILGSINEDLNSLMALRYLAEKTQSPFSAFTCIEQEQRIRTAVKTTYQAPSLEEIEQADVVLVLGDLTEVAPAMDLAVRQVVKKNNPVFVLHAQPSVLAQLLTKKTNGQVFCQAPYTWQQELEDTLSSGTGSDFSQSFKKACHEAEHIVCLAVADNLDCATIEILHKVVQNLDQDENKQVQLGFALPGSNAVGAALVSPLDSIEQILQAIENGEVETLVCCSNDIFATSRGHKRWQQAKEKIKNIVVFDNVNSETVGYANLFIPLATWPERSGTSINYQGYLQTFERSYKRTGVYSLSSLIVKLNLFPAEQFTLWKDHWLIEAAGFLTLDPKLAKKINLSRCLTDTSSSKLKVDTLKKESVQIIERRWYGYSYKAQYAKELTSLQPYSKTSTIWLHPDTAKKIGIEQAKRVRLKGAKILLEVQKDWAIAQNCLAMAANTLAETGLDSGQLLVVSDFLSVNGGEGITHV